MAQCTICSHEKARDINRLLLTRGQITAVAREYGLNRGTVFNHLRKHLPWRSRRHPRAVTVEEQLEEMKYELRRLQVLGECGESIGGAIQALRERRAVVELEARLAGLTDSTHRKLLLASRPPEGDYKVIFENGRPRTVKVGEK
jgi:transposase-like protein